MGVAYCLALVWTLTMSQTRNFSTEAFDPVIYRSSMESAESVPKRSLIGADNRLWTVLSGAIMMRTSHELVRLTE